MNIFKHILVIGILTVSCNALGMMGFGKELTKQQTSITRKKEAQLIILGLQCNEKDQPRLFELISKGDMRNKAENKELDIEARHAYKYLREPRQQKQDKVILKNSSPRNRRRTL
jgi:hypothetical protein